MMQTRFSFNVTEFQWSTCRLWWPSFTCNTSVSKVHPETMFHVPEWNSTELWGGHNHLCTCTKGCTCQNLFIHTKTKVNGGWGASWAHNNTAPAHKTTFNFSSYEEILDLLIQQAISTWLKSGVPMLAYWRWPFFHVQCSYKSTIYTAAERSFHCFFHPIQNISRLHVHVYCTSIFR